MLNVEFHLEVPARNRHIRSEIRKKYFLHGRPNKGSWNYVKIKGMTIPAASSTTVCRPNCTNHRGQHLDTYNCCRDKDKGNLQVELLQMNLKNTFFSFFFFYVKFKWTERSDTGFVSIHDLGPQNSKELAKTFLYVKQTCHVKIHILLCTFRG